MRLQSCSKLPESYAMLTVFGVLAGVVMVVSYGLEPRGRRWVALFAVGCVGAATYGALTGAWLFVVLELVWAGIATHRFTTLKKRTS